MKVNLHNYLVKIISIPFYGYLLIMYFLINFLMFIIIDLSWGCLLNYAMITMDAWRIIRMICDCWDNVQLICAAGLRLMVIFSLGFLILILLRFLLRLLSFLVRWKMGSCQIAVRTGWCLNSTNHISNYKSYYPP